MTGIPHRRLELALPLLFHHPALPFVITVRYRHILCVAFLLVCLFVGFVLFLVFAVLGVFYQFCLGFMYYFMLNLLIRRLILRPPYTFSRLVSAF